MTDYKVNFKELKSRVGIDDIAYALVRPRLPP